MTKNKQAIAALSMDLKRVALSYYHNSERTAERFMKEALTRKEEITASKVKPYIRNLLVNLPRVLEEDDKSKVAEDALMYSTLFQNYALR